MKTGIVVEGGGMRGIYSAGVLDRFLELGIHFDYGAGASAGGANLVTFQAHQLKRNYRFYHDYSQDPAFLSLRSYLKYRQYFGLDYIYDDLATTHGKDPIDFPRMMQDPAELEVVATRCDNGEAVYFSKSQMSLNHYDVIKASCAIPIACRPVFIDGVPYVDGGVSDPLPIARALSKGCDFLVIVLVHHWPHEVKQRKENSFYRHALKEYPAILSGIMKCDMIHEEEVQLAFRLKEQNRAMILMPDHDEDLGSATRNQKILQKYYDLGVQDADQIGKELLARMTE